MKRILTLAFGVVSYAIFFVTFLYAIGFLGSTPTMTAMHLLFAVVTTAYILFAKQLEERDLMPAHPEYAEYRHRVPMLMPHVGISSSISQP